MVTKRGIYSISGLKETIRAGAGGVLAAVLLIAPALGAGGERESAIAYRAQPAFDAGTAAYDAGDFAAAFKAWLPLAQDGDPAAQRNVAHLYRNGLGVPQDFERAFAWYKRAAELGLARAQANLAEMFLRGQGTTQNAGEAVRWFQRAAHQGHAISQYRLAQLLLRGGEGFKKNPKAALFWLKLSAEGDYPPARAAWRRLKPADDDAAPRRGKP